VLVVDITKNNYSILATVDLTKFKSLADLQTHLLPLKKDVYQVNERILFIYNNQSSKVLNLVKELLIDIDIPEFFTIFEPTDSYDPTALDYELGERSCIYPWINLRISTTGDISPCCYYDGYLQDKQGNTLNINKTNLKEIYLGTAMSQLRQQFRSGQRPTGCKNCWQREDDGLPSMRQNGKSKFKEIYYTINWNLDDINNLQLFDLNLSNLCNLSCRICGPHSSVEIGKKDVAAGRLSESKFIEIQKSVEWEDTDQFWGQMEELIPNIRYLDLYGGETMMSKKHFNFLRKLVTAKVSEDIKLFYNTNGTFYSDKFFDSWSHFKSVRLNISVDDMYERFEYQRNGSDWTVLLDNVKKFKDRLSDTFSIEIFPTVNIQNVYYLPELVSWAESLELPIYFNMLLGPKFLSVDYLPQSARIAVIDKLSTRSDHLLIAKLISKLENVTYDGINQEFLDYMKRLDQERQQSFVTTHTEIAKLIGYE
jgi:MoaA/NifB/PqqE/SkfB family radical SAM enzyme